MVELHRLYTPGIVPHKIGAVETTSTTIPATRGLFSLVFGAPRWDRGKRAVLPLGYVNFTKGIFRQKKKTLEVNWKLVSGEVRKL